MSPRDQQTDFNGLVGENLKRYRRVAGLSQADLASKLGPPFDQSTIARTEGGLRPLKVEEALTIAELLDIDPASLWAPVDEVASARAEHMEAMREWAAIQREREEVDRIRTAFNEKAERVGRRLREASERRIELDPEYPERS
jgi:transcriptional regulator with XRE-family HTH domain